MEISLKQSRRIVQRARVHVVDFSLWAVIIFPVSEGRHPIVLEGVLAGSFQNAAMERCR